MVKRRLAILGLGMAVGPHAKSLVDLADRAEVVWACSPSPERCRHCRSPKRTLGERSRDDCSPSIHRRRERSHRRSAEFPHAHRCGQSLRTTRRIKSPHPWRLSANGRSPSPRSEPRRTPTRSRMRGSVCVSRCPVAPERWPSTDSARARRFRPNQGAMAGDLAHVIPSVIDVDGPYLPAPRIVNTRSFLKIRTEAGTANLFHSQREPIRFGRRPFSARAEECHFI